MGDWALQCPFYRGGNKGLERRVTCPRSQSSLDQGSFFILEASSKETDRVASPVRRQERSMVLRNRGGSSHWPGAHNSVAGLTDLLSFTPGKERSLFFLEPSNLLCLTSSPLSVLPYALPLSFPCLSLPNLVFEILSCLRNFYSEILSFSLEKELVSKSHSLSMSLQVGGLREAGLGVALQGLLILAPVLTRIIPLMFLSSTDAHKLGP